MKAYRGSAGIAQLIFNTGTRHSQVVSLVPQQLYPPRKEPLVPTGKDAGWAPDQPAHYCREVIIVKIKFLTV